MTEEWRTIEGYTGYEVSNFGRVRSLKRAEPKLLKLNCRKGGYLYAHLSNGPHKKNELVHRLVAVAFVENKSGKPCVNHINNIRSDNRAENLEWVTHKENSEWMVKCGRQSHLGYPYPRPVIATNIKSGEEKRYRSTNATRKDGFNQSNVWQCCEGMKKAHLGYTFHYA